MNFYNNPVTHFIVSKNGLVSFDTANASMPVATALNQNTNLPNANLPDKTLAMFWEDTSSTSISSFDEFNVRCYGSAPNRQLWIYYYSFEVGTRSFAYWAAVLEGGANKIYVVDMNYGSLPPTIAGTVGVRVDAATAYEVSVPLNGNSGFLPEILPWVLMVAELLIMNTTSLSILPLGLVCHQMG
ncbi:MAG: hypothetical protein U5L96_07175 [Owenweeksia sp.]|nr:hypothetical protein [Owenweeksia sp.]